MGAIEELVQTHGMRPCIQARTPALPVTQDREMLAPASHRLVRLPAEQRPALLVVVDTEEEFDWGLPFSPANRAVTAVRHIHRVQDLFDRYGLRPTYVVDYPVASQEDGAAPLREILRDGRCQIGAHLHPWVNPPHDEVPLASTSFPGNLPRTLEQVKLARLKGTIEDSFRLSPTIYKAGRYGVGPHTAGILARLGFQVDCSVVPSRDYRAEGGPSFQDVRPLPYWFGPDAALLELPVTCGFTGLLDRMDIRLAARLTGPAMPPALPSALSRSGLLNRVQLTPEGVPLAEALALTRALLRQGVRLFQLTFHSPSAAPGHTPYVRTPADLDRFLGWIDAYCQFFFGEIGGVATTPDTVLEQARALSGRA